MLFAYPWHLRGRVKWQGYCDCDISIPNLGKAGLDGEWGVLAEAYIPVVGLSNSKHDSVAKFQL